MIDERTISVTTHGRYLVAVPAHSGANNPAPLLVGFHGYAEDPSAHLNRLSTITGAGGWLMVSVQALHRFYRGRSEDVVASWMTRQDRDLMIADNIAYVSAVIDAVSREWHTNGTLALAGFSQGVATAFRSACRGSHRARGVLACGADIPPELDRDALSRLSMALIGRGERDEWYSPTKFAADDARLRAANVDVKALSFEGGHEWPPEFSEAAGAFLDRLAKS
jgi:predicted esterase